MSKSNIVAVVTGASRGIGKGIAIALGSHGCTVYATGRSQNEGEADLPGTIHATARAVTAAGGSGIAVPLDHSDDGQTKALFELVEREHGHIDILVNNAAKVSDVLTQEGPFWKKPLDLVDLLDVGLRSGYVCSWYAAPMMVRQGRGLIIFTGSQGAVSYMMGPVYGAHKAGEDKFAADMGYELRNDGLAVLSLWCGGVSTERTRRIVASNPEKFAGILDICETPEFSGHVIWGLFNDPKLMELSGQAVIGAEMAVKYGIVDEGGRQPPSVRALFGAEPRLQPLPGTIQE